MQFHHIIFPTHAMPAINSLPKPSPLESLARWLGGSVTRIVLSHGTIVIDRALAEDLASVFDVTVDELPLDATGIVGFIHNYVNNHSEHGIDILMYRLQVVAGRLYDMMEKMIASYDEQ